MNTFELTILISGAVLLLLCTLFFFKKKENFNEANFWLFSILVLFFYNIVFNVLYWSNINSDLLIKIKYSYLFPTSLYGAFFYFYIRNLTTGKPFKLKDSLHFIPFVVFLVSFWRYYALSLTEKKAVIDGGYVNDYIFSIPRIDWLFCILMLCYAIFSYVRFRKYFLEDGELKKWLKTIHAMYTIFVLSYFAYYFLVYFNKLKIEHDYIITLNMIIFMGLIAYFGYFYASIFNGKSLVEIIPFVKYEKTGLTNKHSLELKDELLEIMQNEKPYLNSELRLNHLANKLNISRNNASQVINEHFNKSFFEFVNSYRIEEAIRLLDEDISNRFSISDILYQSGFNNRVSFYKAFKKSLGVTPTDYKNHNMAS